MDNLEHVKDFKQLNMCETVFYKTDSGHQEALFMGFGKKDIRKLGLGAMQELYHLPELKRDHVWLMDLPILMNDEILRKSPKEVFIAAN